LEPLFFDVGCAISNDAKRAAYISILWGVAIVLEGEKRLYTVAKPFAIESISRMLS